MKIGNIKRRDKKKIEETKKKLIEFGFLGEKYKDVLPASIQRPPVESTRV